MENHGIGLNRRRHIGGGRTLKPLKLESWRHIHHGRACSGVLWRNFSAIRPRRTCYRQCRPALSTTALTSPTWSTASAWGTARSATRGCTGARATLTTALTACWRLRNSHTNGYRGNNRHNHYHTHHSHSIVSSCNGSHFN
jgi:hypothetical protein